MIRRFKVILVWDSEEKVYAVTVPALPGCVTQGKNREEALERVQEAIAGHLYCSFCRHIILYKKCLENCFMDTQ
ncbi:MAG: type II toxin-antitoxin system HicB family antitoxin [Eubacteriales bacterium]